MLPNTTFDRIIFTLGNMFAVITLSACLLVVGWIGFLALWLTFHCTVCLWMAWELFFAKNESNANLDYHGYGD